MTRIYGGIPNEGIFLYAEKMRDVLSRPHLHELAVSCGFCKRNGKLKPEVFFALLFYTVSHTEEGSLSYMVSLLKSEFGICIKKQSLHERFTDRSVSFVKSVLAEVINEQFCNLYSKEFLPEYARILIKDSTKFFTPSTLSDNYKSCGNGRSKSSISIQYEFDLKSGSVTYLEITSGNRNDRTDAEATCENTENGDLIIRDMGYFCTSVLKKWSCTDAKKVFYISRLDCNTNVYDSNGERVCFQKVYKSMRDGKIIEMEMQVFIGEQTRLPVRLLLRLVPDEVYEKRIVEKTKKSKGQGRGQLTNETKRRCRFTLFITNADEATLSTSQVFLLYKLRWQIELQFKGWKSVFKIDTLHRMKEHRYITLLYVKLMQVMLNMQIIYSVQRSIIQKDYKKIKIISVNKSLKTLKRLFYKTFIMFCGVSRKFKEIAQHIHNVLSEDHLLESKNKKICFPEILQLLICISEK